MISRAEADAVSDRFWPKVDVRGAGECWPWIAARVGHGYGVIWVGTGRRQRSEFAHRVAFVLFGGDVTAPVVRHSCDRPECVNPAHLLHGTHADNARDRVDRGRGARGVRTRSTALRAHDVVCVWGRLRTGDRGIRIAKDYGITPASVSAIRRGLNWGWLTSGLVPLQRKAA